VAKGVPEKTVVEIVTDFGQPGLQAVDRMVAEGVPAPSAVKVLKAAQRSGVADEVIDLVNSGKLRNSATLRRFIDGLEVEVAAGKHGKQNELLEAKSRADAGKEVSIGGSKFDKAKPESGQADVVQYGADPEALQMKTVTSADEVKVSSNLDYAVSQLKGKYGEVPPQGAKRIARALVENPKNPLYGANRQQLVESLRGNMQNIDPGDIIEIQIRNGTGEHVIQAGELLP
jgi:hypothetical protein